MVYLEILGLILGACGALYGIWTRTPRNNTVATISTVITVLGLAAAAGLAIWKSTEAAHNAVLAEQKRQGQLQAVLTSADLSDMEIVWTFESVPTDVLRAFTVGDMIVDTNFLRDDERSRLPQETRAMAAHAWQLENTVFPLLHVIDVGAFDPKALYDGEPIENAVHRWESDKVGWRDNIGTDIRYVGPVPELIFPLNTKSDAALSLGKVSDDPALDAPRFGWQEDDPSLFKETNFEFHVKAESLEHGFKLSWSYSRASLNRAVERDKETKLGAGFPADFAFVIVRKQLQKGQYLTAIPKRIEQAESPAGRPKTPAWDVNSTLEIYVNGLQNPHYVYAVTKAGTESRSIDQGAYDAPEFQYDYTKFNCRLKNL